MCVRRKWEICATGSGACVTSKKSEQTIKKLYSGLFFVPRSNVMACKTRSKDVWLLEKSPTSSFPGNRLSSRGEVLQVFLFHHKIQKEVLLVAAASTAEKVMEV